MAEVTLLNAETAQRRERNLLQQAGSIIGKLEIRAGQPEGHDQNSPHVITEGPAVEVAALQLQLDGKKYPLQSKILAWVANNAVLYVARGEEFVPVTNRDGSPAQFTLSDARAYLGDFSAEASSRKVMERRLAGKTAGGEIVTIADVPRIYYAIPGEKEQELKTII